MSSLVDGPISTGEYIQAEPWALLEVTEISQANLFSHTRHAGHHRLVLW